MTRAVAAALLVLLVACGGSDDSPTIEAPSSTTVAPGGYDYP